MSVASTAVNGAVAVPPAAADRLTSKSSLPRLVTRIRTGALGAPGVMETSPPSSVLSTTSIRRSTRIVVVSNTLVWSTPPTSKSTSTLLMTSTPGAVAARTFEPANSPIAPTNNRPVVFSCLMKVFILLLLLCFISCIASFGISVSFPGPARMFCLVGPMVRPGGPTADAGLARARVAPGTSLSW